jgi:hypothetical protein
VRETLTKIEQLMTQADPDQAAVLMRQFRSDAGRALDRVNDRVVYDMGHRDMDLYVKAMNSARTTFQREAEDRPAETEKPRGPKPEIRQEGMMPESKR